MSSLSDVEKRYLERLLDMGSGYVLDFSDPTFGEFFRKYNVHIHGPSYQNYGTSKAKKLRAFWDTASDPLVGRVLQEMLDIYEADCDLNNKPRDEALLRRCRDIVDRMLGQKKDPKKETVEDFLQKDFRIPELHKLPIEAPVARIVEGRIKEARAAFSAQAYLSVIFLCGSILEAVLLGAAQREPARFNQSPSSPKSGDGKVKPFHEWTLSQFIETASVINLIKKDVLKFSHGLREFRNYIHPYQQLVSGFTPDGHTAKVCFQVLCAALADIAGER